MKNSLENLQDQRERNNFRLAGLPARVLRYPKQTLAYGIALVKELKQMEEQMTEWEDLQTPEFLELLPWWEDRLKYRELKKFGAVPEVEWWQAIAFVEAGRPVGLKNGYEWGISKKAQPKKKLP